MRLLRRVRERAQTVAQPAPAARRPESGLTLDWEFDDPEFVEFQNHAKAGRWPQLHELIDNMNWMDREHFVGLIADLDGRPGWLDDWVSQRPDSAIPLVARGTHAIGWAWQVRGSGRAETVTSEAWPVFFERLRIAERDLRLATRLDPADPTPWTHLVTTGRALQITIEEQCERFDQAIERERWLPIAHEVMLQSLCAKWSGSSRMMFMFARDSSGEAPEGSPVHQLVPVAHFEEWIDRDERKLDYWSDPAVRQEIAEAADRSVFSPAYSDKKHGFSALNEFAAALYLTDDRDRTRRVLEMIGDRVTSAPWNWLGNPIKVFEQARDYAGITLAAAAAH